MYNDNLRQIEHLQTSNTEIRLLLSSFLNTNTNENTYASRNRNRTRERNPNLMNNMQNIYYTQNRNQQMNSVNARRPVVRDMFHNLSGFTNLESFFEPIVIFPTPSQIENATRNVLYRDISHPTNQSCPISLEPFHDNDLVTVIRYCGHIFFEN